MSAIVDTSAFYGVWPFRITGPRSAGDLKAILRAGGIGQAWVSPVEAILAPDPMVANRRLISEIGGDGFFVPVGVVDVTLATWRRDAKELLDSMGCGALKIFPGYDGFDLTAKGADEAAELADEAGVPLCVQVLMMDDRAEHPLLRAEPPSASDVAALAERHPGTRFLACGVYRAHLAGLRDAPNVWVETSHIDSDRALARAVEELGADRLVFGSHSPYHYLAASLAKLDAPAGDVRPEVVEAVGSRNAARLLAGGAA